MAPPGSSAKMAASLAARRQLARGEPAEPDEILRLEVRRLAQTDHDQALSLEACRDDEFQRRVFLAGKALGLSGPRDLVDHRRAQDPAGGGTELQSLVAEDNDDALGGGRERSKAEL